MNPLKPGTAMEERQTRRKTAAKRGITFRRPPNSEMRRVCLRSDSMPTMRKSPPVLMPWFSIW